jgi:hypothetical protein
MEERIGLGCLTLPPKTLLWKRKLKNIITLLLFEMECP